MALPDAVLNSKFDLNHNGVLDLNELELPSFMMNIWGFYGIDKMFHSYQKLDAD